MINNYFKIAWRNLLGDKQFTFLNLLGLSTGLACVLCIYLWVNDEQSIDKFHKNDSRLYQVMGHIKLPDGIHTQENTPGQLARSMAKDLPEVEKAVAVQAGHQAGALSAGDMRIRTERQFIEQGFFDVFSYTLKEGDKEHPFSGKYDVLISDQLAMKLFNTSHGLIGKTLRWNDDQEVYRISGIFGKPGARSSIQFDALFNYELFFQQQGDDILNWQNSNPSTFIVVKSGTDIPKLNKKITRYLQTKLASAPLTLSLQKYSDRYLYNTYDNGVQSGGRIGYIHLFSIIAAFILIIACINFINLSTAKAARRTKEIGIRKVAGANRNTLIAQHLGESTFLVLLSVAIALILVACFIPQFNHIIGKELVIPTNMNFIAALLLISIVTSIIAGSYPAFYLSGFNPTSILKGKLRISIGEVLVRKGLVVFQFTLSAIFIIAVLIIYEQMKLIQTINLGYDKENVITFRSNANINRSFRPFMAQVESIPGVVNASAIDGDFTGNTSGSTEHVEWPGKKEGSGVHFSVMDIDYDLMGMMGIKMREGRSFTLPSDALGSDIILNKAAVDAMGITNPIGQSIVLWEQNYRIAGVAENFHFESIHEQVKPCIMRCVPSGSNILVKVTGGNERTVIKKLDQLYHKYTHGIPFEYSFLDQDYRSLYVSEERVAVLSKYFAGLGIIISCLGLFGLAAFTAQKRQKEIGVRKVVGASVSNITFMLSKDFLMLVLTAIFFAFPLAWLLMQHWLQNFAYRISIGPGIFFIAALLVILITLFTISFQAIRAAIANPVKSLRAE